jgi:hypothetical protein
MAKKILVFVAAIMALAVVPAAASATNSPEAVESGGTKVPVGSKILATNTETVKLTDVNGNTVLSCGKAWLTGEVTKNDGSNVEGTISGAEFHNVESTTCSGIIGSDVQVTPHPGSNPSTNGLPWCIRSTSTMATHEFQVRGNSCSGLTRPIRFVLHAPFANECVYQRTAAIPGTFTTGIGSTTLAISKVEFERLSGSSPCPDKGFLDMRFTLHTDVSPYARIDLI